MKIHIPEFKAMARCNEHLNHGPIDIDLGEDVVKVVRCKDCVHAREKNNIERSVYYADIMVCECPDASDGGSKGVCPDDYCSYGERVLDDG